MTITMLVIQHLFFNHLPNKSHLIHLENKNVLENNVKFEKLLSKQRNITY